jgi:hypothetical protein
MQQAAGIQCTIGIEEGDVLTAGNGKAIVTEVIADAVTGLSNNSFNMCGISMPTWLRHWGGA